MSRLVSIGALALGLLVVASACGTTEQGPDTISTNQGTAGDATVDDSVAKPAVVTGAGPGISVTEALQSTLAGPLLVNGLIVTTADGTVYLAEGLAESLPPQRAGETLIVKGLELDTFPGLTSAQGITWSDQPVQVLGEVANGVLTMATTATG